jgi:hypothetical protein
MRYGPPCASAMGPIGPELRERNREILAERLHWLDGALEVCRQLEVMYPGTSVWWGIGRLSDPKPGFYARRGDRHYARTFYGETAIDPTERASGQRAATAVVAAVRGILMSRAVALLVVKTFGFPGGF